jgi:hypothetical protein
MISIAIDVDWAPEIVIEDTINLFLDNKIKSTWFITHNSKSIQYLQQNEDMFETGIHPNLLANSTQGRSMKEIFDNLLSICPNARYVRTHAYYQSTYYFSYLSQETRIEIDASLIMPRRKNIEPFNFWIGGRDILRFPVYWEDDLEIQNPLTENNLNSLGLNEEGLKIFVFHPIHIFLNSATFSQYRLLKEAHHDITKISSNELEKYSQSKQIGVRDLLIGLMDNESERIKTFPEIRNFYKNII